MKYLLKLRVRKNTLSDEITRGLKSTYLVDGGGKYCRVCGAKIECQIP